MNDRRKVPSRFAAIAVAGFMFFGKAGEGKAQGPAATCFPACRPGYVCMQGQCASACNPVCPANEICNPAGQCVSACNPRCAANQDCSPQGQCVAQPPAYGAPPPAAASYGSSPVAPAQPLGASGPTPPPYMAFGTMPGMTPDAGWARGAAIFGYVSAAVILVLTVAVIANNDSINGDTARNLGIAATVYIAGSIPVIEIGGASARNYPMVRGAPGLRVASWIGYVVTLIDAATLVGVSYSSPVDSGHILSVGLLGSLSAVGFAIDAQISASDANALRKQVGYSKVDGSLKLAPVVTTARTHNGAVVPTFGLRAAF